MDQQGLPQEAASLIRAHIESIGQLEILLLLHSLAPAALTPEKINGRLSSNVSFVRQTLQTLTASGLAEQDPALPGQYHYAPKTPELDRAVTSLAECYVNYRVRVIDTIYAPRDQLQSFSDAFRIKKDPGNDG